MQDVLDPFDIEDGWFQIELTQFHVVANPDLDPELAGQVNTTISRLALNSRQCRELRMQYADDYWAGQITYAYLLRRAPFIAKELRRQNRLRFADA